MSWFGCVDCFFFFSSRRRHTRCALVTGVQTCALPISSGPDTRVVGFTVRDGKDGIKIRGAGVVEDNLLTNLATDAVDFPRDNTGLAQHNIMENKIGRASCRERVCPYV